MQEYIYMYIYIHIYTDICRCIHMNLYVHTNPDICVYTFIHIYLYICLCRVVHMHIYIHICTYIHIYTVRIYTTMYKYTHIYYSYIYMQARAKGEVMQEDAEELEQVDWKLKHHHLHSVLNEIKAGVRNVSFLSYLVLTLPPSPVSLSFCLFVCLSLFLSLFLSAYVSRSRSHAVVSERSVNECHYKSVCICVRLLMRRRKRESTCVCACERACMRARAVCALHSRVHTRHTRKMEDHHLHVSSVDVYTYLYIFFEICTSTDETCFLHLVCLLSPTSV